MFHDFYRMADELHRAIEPYKQRKTAAWNEFISDFKRQLPAPKSVEIVYDIYIRVNSKKGE